MLSFSNTPSKEWSVSSQPPNPARTSDDSRFITRIKTHFKSQISNSKFESIVNNLKLHSFQQLGDHVHFR